MQPPPLKHSTGPFWGAILLSLILNAAGIQLLYQVQRPSQIKPVGTLSPPIIYDLKSPQKQSYVDTPETPSKPRRPTENLSDKDSSADSALDGNTEGLLPESVLKALHVQAPRVAKTSPKVSPAVTAHMLENQIKATEQIENKAREHKKLDEVSWMGESLEKESSNVNEESERDPESVKPFFPASAELMDLDVNLTKEVPSQNSGKDLFPLPFLSIGDRTLSERGVDAFDATGSPLGIYYKQMRDKMGLYFYRMIHFHYRTNHIFGSQANIEFKIEPTGYVRGIQALDNHGDPLFAAYCESVVKNAAPFAPMEENMAPYLEDGVLRMNILFGFDVQEK